MESATHRGLKASAERWARAQGYALVAQEVRAPVPRYRADVAGVMVERGRAVSGVLVECKATRADFLRDASGLGVLLRRREALHALRERIEREFVHAMEPWLCRQAALFEGMSELGEWDYERSALVSYQRVVRELARLDDKIHGSTKFFTMARYRLASRLMIAAPAGMIDEHELPPGWGLLAWRSLDAEPEEASPGAAHSAGTRVLRRLMRSVLVAQRRDASRAEPSAPGTFVAAEGTGVDGRTRDELIADRDELARSCGLATLFG